MIRSISVIILSCLSLFIQAQTAAQLAFQKAIDENKKDPENYSAPLNVLHTITLNEDDLAGRNTWLQAMSTYYSFLGDYQNTLKYSDERYSNMLDSEVVECDTTFFLAHEFQDARTYIIERMKQERIVMLNEAHHIPYHRAFAISLLEDLYKNGFHYFAIETLTDTTINKTKSVTDTAGYYIREPLFAELIRYALSLGFKLVSYEPLQGCDNKGKDSYYCNRFRDSLMAVNLAHIVHDDPKAKVFVYAGYDHIQEGSKNGWKKMGSFLHEMTGINPLSISQTKHIEYLHPQFETKEFTAANNLEKITSPVVALHQDSAWHDRYVDISIIHPRYIKKEKRAEFYSIFNQRRVYPLKPTTDKRVKLVQAFYSTEYPGHRVPADQIQLQSENNVLYLFAGEYQLEFKDTDGKMVNKEMIKVSEP